MEQKIPEDLKKYDTPETRQAYQSSKQNTPMTSSHEGVPQELWAFDTAENRQAYRQQTLTNQMRGGLVTSDQRVFQLTPEQVNWVSNKYKQSWEYAHDAFDQQAKADGYLPPSMYKKYNEKSAYDVWAMQMGMPNEKELEKYLSEYDDWTVQYQADEKKYNDAVAKYNASANLLGAFYDDVADQLYKAEFRGVQRGSEDWNKIFFDTLNQPKYASLGDHYSGVAAAEAAAEKKKKKSEEAESELPTTAEGSYVQAQVDRRKAAREAQEAKDKAIEAGTGAALTEEEIAAIVAEQGYYFPEVPDLSFNLNDFTSMYDRNVTMGETERGYGKINGAVRDAAAKIGYTTESSVSVDDTTSARYTGSGGIHGGRSGSFGEPTSTDPFGSQKSARRAQEGLKLAKQTDVAAVCKDLALGGYNTEEYWSVVGGLTAGSPTSENPYGPGFYFDTATQYQAARYGDVVATRFGTDMLGYILDDASDETLQAYVANAVEHGATQEMLTRAYDAAMAALGGVDEDDTSRDWDGLTNKERKKRDKAFKKRFDAAVQAAPSLPIGSGWSNLESEEDVRAVAELRSGFDLDSEINNTRYVNIATKAMQDHWKSLTPEGRLANRPTFDVNDMTLMGMMENLAEGHGPEESGTKRVGRYAALSQFREDAKAHGYSDWEIDQFFRGKGMSDRMPDESWEEYDLRKAQHYREYLLESANAAVFESGVAVKDVGRQSRHGGTSGSFAASESEVESPLDKERRPAGYAEPLTGNPAVDYFNSLSDEDLVYMMKVDQRTANYEHAWVFSPAMMITRGVETYAAGFVNFADMIANGRDAGDDSWEIAQDINKQTQMLASYYRHDNQSKFVATVTDAGAELVRMYLVAQTGGALGELAGGALSIFGEAGASAATWLSSGSGAANLVKWGIESVPFITGAMGSSYAEARSEGASNADAMNYAVLAGIVEGLTEKVSVELLIGEGGSKVTNAVIGKLMNSGVSSMLAKGAGIVGVNLLKMGLNAFVEATQEGASYVLDLLLKKAIYNPDEKFSWKELGQQAGMGALCGAMGLAFQNYGASYVNSMMEFALSSPKNMQKFADFAMKQYGVNLGTDENYVVQASDYDVTKILPTSEFNDAWKTYLDSSDSLAAAQRQYESAIASLDADDTEKARQVLYWKNQIASLDPNDAASASAMAHALEQLTIAERTAADTEAKNKKLRTDARTELNNVRKRTQNAMDESSAKIRAHSRAEIAATLGLGDTALDSSYDLIAADPEAEKAKVERQQQYMTAVNDALSALDSLEQAADAQKAAKAKLYDAAVSTLAEQYADKPTVAGALQTVNRLAQIEEARAESLEAAADGVTAEIQNAKRRDEQRVDAYGAELDTYDDWYEATVDEIVGRDTANLMRFKAGEITREQYEASKARSAEDLRAARDARNDQWDAAAESYAAEGGTSTALTGLADSLRLEASEAREKAENIRNAVVRALAYRTQEAALAAVDQVTTSEGVLTVEQREALSDELNQIVADQLSADEATRAVYDAIGQLELLEQQADTKTEKPAETASETQEAPVQSEQVQQIKTPEERQAELDKAVAIGKMLGVDVQIVNDLPRQIAGRYTNGVLYISANADNAPMRVLVHEMTHYLEGTTAYHNLEQYVFGVMGGDPNFNLNAEIASYRTLYAEARTSMDQDPLNDADAEEEARAEIVARWCEKNLFTNEQSINKLCASQQSLGKRILNSIQNLLAGKRGTPVAAELQQAEKLYIKALKAAKAFGGGKAARNSVISTLVAAGLYVDTEGGAFKVYRTRYDSSGNRTMMDALEPNYESPVDGPITTDDIMNHSPIGAFIRLGQKHGTLPAYTESELEPGTNLRAIPTENLSAAGRIVNLFTDLSNMCLAYGDNQMVWDLVGGYVFSAITSNSDPQYSRTVDFGTICRKTQNLVTAMSNAMVEKGRGLYAEEIIELQNRMLNNTNKIDAPCSMCYVFKRWLGLGGYLNRVKVYQDRYAAMTPQELYGAFAEVKAQLEAIVNPAPGEGNYEALIRDLAAKHGLDPQTYLDALATQSRAYNEDGWVRGRKSDVAMSEARTKSLRIMHDAQIYAQLLEDCLESYDLKGIKNPTNLDTYNDIQQRMELTDAYGWLTKVLFNVDKQGNVKLKRSVLSEDGQSWKTDETGNPVFVVPTEVLFDLNASDVFATKYPDVWKFRTSGGSALGKATYGYTDARLGEFTYGASVSSVKSQEVPKAPRYGIGAERSTSRTQPKNKLSFVNWRGEFASGGEKTFLKAMDSVKKQAFKNGDRMQSSSDYTSKNALDYLLTAFEMQCLGAPVQTYSKVPEGISFFDAIGASVNISLIGKGKGYTGTPSFSYDETSGRWKADGGELSFSTVQGVDPEVARALSSVSNSAQPILVAMNREHAALAISTPWIQMIIPVHMSGGTVDNISARAEAQGDPALIKGEINDATDCQNDKVLTNDELVEKHGRDGAERRLTARQIRQAALAGNLTPELEAKIDSVDSENGLLRAMVDMVQRDGITQTMKKDNALGVGIYNAEYWDTTSTLENADVNGDRFKEYCDMLGVLPRFSYGSYGEQGEPGEPGHFPGLDKFEGYWKSLIDRKMYNTDGTYRAATPVDVSGLTANMFNGTAPTSLAARLNDYYANEENRARRDSWFEKTYDKVGRDRPSTGSHLFNAEENARLQAQQAAAAEVGQAYGAEMTGTAVEAKTAHDRYALGGDVDARLAELRKQYGSMPTSGAATAPGREDVVLPRQTNDDTYVRRAAQTFMRSQNITDASASDIGQAVLRGEFDYERQSNDETISKAERRIVALGGQQSALNYLKSVAQGHSMATAETVAIGEQLILDAQEIGDVNAFEEAVVYTSVIGTAAGQTVQAFSMINKLSPQGVALYLNRVIDRLNNVEYKDLIAKGKMKPIQLTEEQTQKLLGVKSFSDATKVQTEILSEIAQQIPLTVKEQLRNWRYLCMLGNVRTNVRNVAGNLAMASMRMSRDVVAAGYEALDVARGESLMKRAAEAERAGDTEKAEKLRRRAERHLTEADRTKALEIGKNAEAFKANKEYARGTLPDAEAILAGSGKDVGLSVLRDQKRMFNPKWLNKVGKVAMSPLEIMDRAFLRPLYVNSYAQWMTARGLTGEDMTLKQRNEAMAYAVNEAQKATFRDANWLATKLTEIRSRNLATELVVGGIMPFAKTPANVLRRGIEYSPAGILQGFSQIYKAEHDANLSRTERMQLRASAIDHLASGTTGTGLLALGIALRAMGVLRGKDDDDDRAAKFFKDMGYQPYSVQIGKSSYTLDWLAPLNMPMFMGTAIYDVAEQLSEGEELDWKDIAEPIMSIADPMIEMSMLQGIQSALKTYGSENALSAVATNTLQSFAGQFYPTILGQTARTIDLTRRSPDSKQYWLQSMAAKVPGLSKIVKPYVGGYGDEETMDPTVGNYIRRGLEQYISPGYAKTANTEELTEELARVYEATGVNKFLPQRPSDYKKLNLGKAYGTYDLNYEEQVEYEKLFRSEAAKALASAIQMPEYKGLSDADKADFLAEVYSQATKAARKEYKAKIIDKYNMGVAATQDGED